MKLTVETKHLEAALKLVARAVPRKSSLPVTQNVLMEVRGNYLQLLGTNLEVALSAVIRGSDGEDGAVAVPPKALQEVLKGKAESVTLQSTPKPVGLSVALRGSTIQFNGVDAAEFPPTSKSETPAATVVASELLKGIAQCLHGVARSDSRPVLTALCMDLWESGSMKLASADSFRLCTYKKGVQKGEPIRVLLPASSARLLQTAIQGTAPEVITVTLHPDAKGVITAVGFALLPTKARLGIVKVSLVSQVVEGTYPSYEQLMPTDNTTEVIVGRQALLEAVKAAQPFANDSGGSIRLWAEGGTVGVSAKAEVLGSYSQELAAEVKGEPGKTAVNITYILEMLAVLKGDNVSLRFATPSSPMVWADPDDLDYLEVIMPMFIQW